ncbi:MAG: hypothetical protein F4Z14_06605 [Gammaproteobacteria bacterium]|nr:hypothetical protein [Gammaproteobacteria bacterium]
MSGVIGLGGLTGWVILHIIAMLMASGYSGFGDAPAGCGSLTAGYVSSWACGTPFEAAIDSSPQDTNLFARAAGVLTGSFGAVLGFLAFDYSAFRSDGIGGIVYDIIRLLSWALLAAFAVSVGLRMFGRG